MSEFTEDKTCRICGLADMGNFNLLKKRCNQVFEKISAVFPIVIYKSDPLPKNICPKCFNLVTSLYDNIQRVVKMQKNWINNVRKHQPNHSYVRVLDLIEKSCEVTARDIRELTNDELVIKDPYRFMKFNIEENTQTEVEEVKSCVLPELSPQKPVVEANFKPPKEKIQHIQSILESNGCSLLTVYPPVVHPERATEDKSIKCKMCPYMHPCDKNLAQHQISHLQIPVIKLFERKFLDKKVRRGRLISVQNQKLIRCLNCWRTFSDNKSILEHWSEGNCDFYCHICGKEYPSNPKFLREHVPAIHGISYRSSKRKNYQITQLHSAINPSDMQVCYTNMDSEILKIKAEPVDELTSIISSETAKSTIQQAPATHPKQSKTLSGNQTTKSNVMYPMVSCNLCNKVFANFKAKNSHMRAHKNVQTISKVTSSFPEIELNMEIKTEIENYEKLNGNMLDNVSQIPTLEIKLENDHSADVIKTPNESSGSTAIEQVKLKVKSLSELQNPALSSSATTEHPYHCHPCGEKFSSKLEMFRHKRKCPGNKLYICQHCSKAFVTSTDMQLHVMLMHQI